MLKSIFFEKYLVSSKKCRNFAIANGKALLNAPPRLKWESPVRPAPF